MWLKWLPWKLVIRYAARSRGFVDPIAVMARLHKFAQPSEVAEPTELLRAGVVFHARGLLNTQAIQHNLDWIWPYWVERQFNPRDRSFIPRAFSITHVNLTHRNWTAVGIPGHNCYPVIDPRGLVTPYFDGWSIDVWYIADDGSAVFPSKVGDDSRSFEQSLRLGDQLAVTSTISTAVVNISSEVFVAIEADAPQCILRIQTSAQKPGLLAVAFRPYNPEGVSFLHRIAVEDSGRCWRLNGQDTVSLDVVPERCVFSDYRGGDVYRVLREHELSGKSTAEVVCDVGMATAAALYRMETGTSCELSLRVDLSRDPEYQPPSADSPRCSWREALGGTCVLEHPDPRIKFLYDAALHTLVLLAPGDGEIYPGPYTYRRFWFRDAALMTHALLCAGLVERARGIISGFPQRQTRKGYFLSQEGEWDSNGQVLWIVERYCQLTNQPLPEKWHAWVERGAHWIVRKRLPTTNAAAHAGLLPAGFSAEHLGPNDYYYWDDFWAVAGLSSAGRLLGDHAALGALFERESRDLMSAIEKSLALSLAARALPASPYRRMDSGAIGSLVSCYPLELLPPEEPRVLETVNFLLRECSLDWGFFQDMVHSGINPYLSLHLGQVLLRAGDERFFDILTRVAELSSSTGQWPEAVHPLTLGGCMGDGQHGWAAAEWVMMIRNCFVREEGDSLILCSGLSRAWREREDVITFGLAPTSFGPISLQALITKGRVEVSWRAEFHTNPHHLDISLPGCATHRLAASNAGSVTIDLG